MSTLEIPGYTIIRKIGEGGMASVLLAIQESLEREVALKFLLPQVIPDQEFCVRFLKEGKTLASLTHPHVLTIFDSGEHQGIYYISMEYIPGGTLEERINNGSLQIPDIVRILTDIGSALDWIHKKGLIHRDIKPANILFRNDDTAVLSDFGIAKSTSKNATRLTQAGFAIGTPAYMSPEQASGQELQPASDQYSLGVMLYEMICGRVPYDGNTGVAIAIQHIQAPLPILPENQKAFEPIIHRMMAKNPSDRFNTLQEMIIILEKTVANQGAETVIKTELINTEPSSPPKSKTRLFILGGAAIVVGLVLVYFLEFRPTTSGKPTDGSVGVVVTPDPPPDPKARKEVDKWLKIAEAHYEIGRFTEPTGSNAMDAYLKVLEIDKNNKRARQGLNDIASQYERHAKELFDKGDIDDTNAIVAEGLKLFPNHNGLVSLQKQIADRNK